MDIEKLIEQLKNLEACAYGYHINGEVLGMDCSDFEQVMVHAADEISKVPALQAENEKLRAELEQMAACVYYSREGYADTERRTRPMSVCLARALTRGLHKRFWPSWNR